MENIVAIIPARGGSKGIIKKNIRILDGKPLIFYQINAALKSNYINKVYVSTDSNEIADIVKGYNNVEVIVRPKELSGDLVKSEDALIHAIDFLEKTGVKIDIILFLQATSPFTKHEDIDRAIEKLLTGYDSICFATEDFGFFLDEEDILIRPMRQQRKPKIREGGNAWVTRKEVLKNTKNRLGGKTGYILINKWNAIEIDEPDDLNACRNLLKIQNRQKANCYFKKRPSHSQISYEQGYWGGTIDPDGNKRDKINEKDQYIEDARSVIDFINNQKPGKILDIGCGFGFLLSAINNDWQKYGTEISKLAAETANNYGNIYIGNLLDTNYKPMSFDIITMYQVIEHLEDPLAYLNKSNELLKIGGKLIISTPDFDSITARRFKENFRLLHDKTHISLFSSKSLTYLLTDNGFEVENIEYPYFETRHFNEENLLRLFDINNISPPFYGNIVNIYAYKC